MSVQANEPAANSVSDPASAGTASPMHAAPVSSITQDCTEAAEPRDIGKRSSMLSTRIGMTS